MDITTLWKFSQGKHDRGNEKTQTEWRTEDDVISFEGTKSVLDWIHNFMFGARPGKAYKDMKVNWYAHRGFKLKFKSIESQLKEYLDSYVSDHLYVTGHSQGAAIATLFHEWVKFNYPKLKVTTVVFASPRVISLLNFKRVKERWADVINVTHWKDVVPKLPPFIFGFGHVGKRFRVDGKVKLSKAHVSYGDYGIEKIPLE